MVTQRRARTEQRKVVKVEQEKKVWPIYAIIAVIAVCGLADATFLFVEYLSGVTEVCTASGYLDCSAVLSSEYAKIGRVPLSGLGAVAYFVVFSLAVLAAYGYRLAASYLPALLSLMFATSLYLVYLQAFKIKTQAGTPAFCKYCLISAGLTTLMTAIIWAAKLTKRV